MIVFYVETAMKWVLSETEYTDLSLSGSEKTTENAKHFYMLAQPINA